MPEEATRDQRAGLPEPLDASLIQTHGNRLNGSRWGFDAKVTKESQVKDTRYELWFPGTTTTPVVQQCFVTERAAQI